MERISADTAWGARVLRTVRIIASCSAAFALLEYLALRVLERQDSCLAYIELMPIMALVVGVGIAGATSVLAAFAAQFEHLVRPRLQPFYRFFFLALVPVSLALLHLFSEFVPLVQTYLTDPDVFCD